MWGGQAGGAWWQMATDTLLPCHPQEAAERESKLLRDLSAANEKNLLLRNQVWGGGGSGASPWEAWGGASGKQNVASSLRADFAGG